MGSKSRFYRYLKKIRVNKNYTQADMAEKLDIPKSTYANYEEGTRSPDLETLERISVVLECSMDALFGRVESSYTGSVRRKEPLYVREDPIPYGVNKSGNVDNAKSMRLGIGISEFRKLREQNRYYVDKTDMIGEFLDSDMAVILITRPRRFGKTLNMSMLAEFFDCTKKSTDIFVGTKIGRMSQYVELNQHPVISLSFLNAKGDTEVELLARIYDVIQKEYSRYRNILQSDVLPSSTRDKMNNIYDKLGDFSSLANVESRNVTVTAIAELSHALKEYYKKDVYILIDEYDTPFISANVGGYYSEIRTFLSVMLCSALKGNESLERAMLTGIQRVAKENIFSGLNNIAVCTVKDPEFSTCFGFTEDETRDLLQYYGLELTDEVKQMYDGYRFFNVEVYNPWSITYYSSRKLLESYWVNTSENSMIQKAMNHCGQSFQRNFNKLVIAGKVTVKVELENSFYEQPGDAALWGLLINAGMVTVLARIDENKYTVCIPNLEVATVFQNLTAYSLQVESELLSSMMYHLKTGDMEEFKFTKDEGTDLKELAEEALRQINQKKYAAELAGEICYIGLAHCGKYAEIACQFSEK